MLKVISKVTINKNHGKIHGLYRRMEYIENASSKPQPIEADGLEVDYVLYSYKYVKRRFNLSHVTKVSAQTFARG